MITGLDHVAIAVKNLEETVRLYETVLGLKAERIESFPPQKVKVAILRLGETKIELISPMSPESTVARFLEKRGEGLHHIAIQVDNLEETLETLKAKGVKLVDEKPRLGVEGVKVAFIHPKSMSGVLVELCQKH